MNTELPRPPLEIGSYFAGYKVHALIGQGGHACVFRAHDEFLDKYVALKVLYRAGGVTPEMIQRGRAEAQFLSSLRHPNVVEVLRAGIENGLMFIVMELLQGRSLRLVQHLAGRLAVEEVLTIAEHIAEGVGAAHQHQAIHRDLKPDNVFICSGNRSKVLDFGIAKLVGQGGWMTQANFVPGTMLYMSPEQVQGMTLGPESDVYALGLIMFTLLSGRHPCLLDGEAPSAEELLRRQVLREPPLLDQLAPNVPPYVAQLVARTLAKLPEQRIRSMSELAATLRALRERYVGEMRQAGRPLQSRDLSSCDFGPELASLAGPRIDPATITDSRMAAQLMPVGSTVLDARPLSPLTPTPSPMAMGHTPPPASAHYKTALKSAIYFCVCLALGLVILLAFRSRVSAPAPAVTAASAADVAAASVEPPVPSTSPLASAPQLQVAPAVAPIPSPPPAPSRSSQPFRDVPKLPPKKPPQAPPVSTSRPMPESGL